MDPATAALIATAVAAAAKGAGDYFSGKNEGKRRVKETKRETRAGMLKDAMQRSAELEASRLQSKGNTAKRRATSSQDTADLVRGALKI